MPEYDDISFEVDENLSFQDESFSELDEFDGEISEQQEISELDDMLGIHEDELILDEFDGEIDDTQDIQELDNLLFEKQNELDEMLNELEENDESGVQYVKKYPY